jgi:ABC-type Fe3+ transport system permease subunit
VGLAWSLPCSLFYAAFAKIFGIKMWSKQGKRLIRVEFIIEGIVSFLLTYYIFSMFDSNTEIFRDSFYLLMIFPLSLFCVWPEQNYKTQKEKSRSNFPNEYLRQRPLFRKLVFGFLVLVSIFFFILSINSFGFKIPYIFEHLEIFSWWILLHLLSAFTHIQIAIKIIRPIEKNEYFTIVDVD